MWPPRNTAETIATRDTKEKKEAHQKKAKVKYEMISSQNDDFSFGFSHFKSLCVTFESLSLCVILSEGKESGVEFIVVTSQVKSVFFADQFIKDLDFPQSGAPLACDQEVRRATKVTSPTKSVFDLPLRSSKC